MLQQVNSLLSKPSAKVEVKVPETLKNGIPIEEREDFKKMFKDLDFSRLTELDQAYIKNFYTKELQKIEDGRKGLPQYNNPNYQKNHGKILSAKGKASLKAKQTVKVFKVHLPTKIKAVTQPQEIKSPPTPDTPKQTKPVDSPKDQKNQKDQKDQKEKVKDLPKNPLVVSQKGFFGRMWRNVIDHKFVLLGLIGFLLMSRYAFSMRKLKKQKEKDIGFNSVGYEYEYFKKDQNENPSRRVLQI